MTSPLPRPAVPTVRSVDPRRQAPLELLRSAQLVYAIGATVPFGRGSAMNAALSHASVALDRALFATVGAFEGMLCPVEDFPLTLEVRPARLALLGLPALPAPALPACCAPSCLPADQPPRRRPPPPPTPRRRW